MVVVRARTILVAAAIPFMLRLIWNLTLSGVAASACRCELFSTLYEADDAAAQILREAFTAPMLVLDCRRSCWSMAPRT